MKAVEALLTPQVSQEKSTLSAADAHRLKEAAKQFEAVFLRHMLSPLEKTAQVGGSTPTAAGQSAYGSMIVEALSDAIANAGGIGLAATLTRELEGQLEAQLQAAKKGGG